ncbi:hypothetical protein ACMBCN_03230 [Candidatus Liberibacter asiaticus]|nr:hypothetical protein [Candidatus Liberibacter asiaticus]
MIYHQQELFCLLLMTHINKNKKKRMSMNCPLMTLLCFLSLSSSLQLFPAALAFPLLSQTLLTT